VLHNELLVTRLLPTRVLLSAAVTDTRVTVRPRHAPYVLSVLGMHRTYCPSSGCDTNFRPRGVTLTSVLGVCKALSRPRGVQGSLPSSGV